jgi:hypothetical protein
MESDINNLFSAGIERRREDHPANRYSFYNRKVIRCHNKKGDRKAALLLLPSPVR